MHLPNGHFGWRERLVVGAQPLFPSPPLADLKQLSMLRVNPPTAALLLSEFVDLKPGDWVIKNAANSGVGRCVIAFSKARRLRTVNVVRRSEFVADVVGIGGDRVLVDGPGKAPICRWFEVPRRTVYSRPIRKSPDGPGAPLPADQTSKRTQALRRRSRGAH